MVGVALTACLLIYANPMRDATEVFIAARDIPAGTPLSADGISLALMHLDGQVPVFARRDRATLTSLVASHDLVAGQVIQHSDATSPAQSVDRRLVFLPLKDTPPVAPGARVDLLTVEDTPAGVSVQPFALGVAVRASVSGGLMIVVTSRQAAAFVYAGATLHLVAVVAEGGSAPGAEAPVSAPDQAIAMASQP